MRIIGLVKIRNEEKIIRDTLNHWGHQCTGGIYVYDDASTDRTLEIVKSHPAVRGVVENKIWDADRERHEWMSRQHVLMEAQKEAAADDWFVYFDADERLYNFDWSVLFCSGISAVACKLYDVYITPEDVDIEDWREREYVGPEYRTIPFFFRNDPTLRYNKPDQRIVDLPPGSHVAVSGIIKHFGKGISVAHWEETCDYYVNHFPKYAEKWALRKGKAVKDDYKSDFGNSLIKFKDVLNGRAEGIRLEDQVYGKR